MFYQGEAFVANNRDKLKLNGDAIFNDPESSSGFLVGRIVEILIPSKDMDWKVQCIALRCFTFGSMPHPSLHVPTLELTKDKKVISSNVGHDT